MMAEPKVVKVVKERKRRVGCKWWDARAGHWVVTDVVSPPLTTRIPRAALGALPVAIPGSPKWKGGSPKRKSVTYAR